MVAPTSTWPCVSSNGSRASNASSSPPGRCDAGDGGEELGGGAALREHRLQHERLVPAQALARGCDVVARLGPVDREQRAAQTREPEPDAGVGRDRVLEVLRQLVQHDRHRTGDLPRRHRRGGRVDGDERPRVAQDGLVDVEVGARLRRTRSVRGVGQQDVVGVGQLPVAVEDADLPREQPDATLPQLVLAPRLLEEGQRELAARAVADHHLEALGPSPRAAVGVDLGVDLLDPRHHGDVLVDLERGEIGELAPLGVAPGVVAQEILERVQPEPLLESRGRAGAHDGREAIGETELGHA